MVGGNEGLTGATSRTESRCSSGQGSELERSRKVASVSSSSQGRERKEMKGWGKEGRKVSRWPDEEYEQGSLSSSSSSRVEKGKK